MMVELSNVTRGAGAGRSSCSLRDVRAKLREAGLRPTVQRVSLARLLFGDGDRHVTARSLFDEAECAGIPVSLATVYNTLNQFSEAGLIRRIVFDAGEARFDTNVGDHQHFLVEGANELLDITDQPIAVRLMSPAPEGYEASRIDVIVRLKPKARTL